VPIAFYCSCVRFSSEILRSWRTRGGQWRFFQQVVEKIAEECDHAGQNLVTRLEYDSSGGIDFCV
jgi:hypothetical protein